jgi:hypothetical protein
MLQSFKVRVEVEQNEFRFGSIKRHLMSWAIEQVEFTKVEFLAYVVEQLESGEITSKMVPDTCSKAWWNEFYAKHKVFKPVA